MAEEPRGTVGVAWLAALGRLEAWLVSEGIPYVVLGGVGVAAWVDQGVGLDFSRRHAYDTTQRMPDIDLLVPRSGLPRVKVYATAARQGDPPLKIDTVAGEKDAPKMAVLAAAIGSGTVPAVFAEAACEGFARYQAARRRRSPVFITAKTMWEASVAALPARAGGAVLHYASPPAQHVIGRLNRERRAA